MTVDDAKGRAKAFGDRVTGGWKILQALIGIGALLVAAWTQFLGSGIQNAAQDFMGVTDIVARLDFVERHMPPPQVVEWFEDDMRQDGECTTLRCVYVMVGARTDYGESCGRPTRVVYTLRLTEQRRNVEITAPEFEPIELTREPRAFEIPFSIPRFIPPGNHQWRARTWYPNCPGTDGDTPRYTPWLPLVVTSAGREPTP